MRLKKTRAAERRGERIWVKLLGNCLAKWIKSNVLTESEISSKVLAPQTWGYIRSLAQEVPKLCK